MTDSATSRSNSRSEGAAGPRRALQGTEAIEEALARGIPVRLVFRRRGEIGSEAQRVLGLAEKAGIPVRIANAREILRYTAGSGSPELLGFVGPDPAVNLGVLLERPGVVWLLAGCAFPGNAGQIARSAEVSGAEGVVIDTDWDREIRRQALRAAIRADRVMPILFEGALATIEAARSRDRRIIAIESSGGAAPWEVDLLGPALIVAGGEVGGVPDAILAVADATVRIPTEGFIPSYNVHAAVAMIMAERLRQESTAGAHPTI